MNIGVRGGIQWFIYQIERFPLYALCLCLWESRHVPADLYLNIEDEARNSMSFQVCIHILQLKKADQQQRAFPITFKKW